MADRTPTDDEMLITYLKDRDVHCPVCKYNLRNSSRSVCPECGEVLMLSVGAREASHHWWILVTVALSLVSGVGLIFVYIVLTQGMPPRSQTPHGLVYLFIISAPSPILPVLLRNRLIRQAEEIQWTVTIAALIYAMIMFIWLFGTFD